MMHVYVYCYFGMNPCIYIMYLSVYILYIMFHKSFVCICFICMQFKKFKWHSSVLDVGYVTICSTERTKVFSRVSWPDLGGRGHYNRYRKYIFHEFRVVARGWKMI
jgi:hypothetical protein